MEIHPLAVVHPTARLGNGVVIGPFSVVEAEATIGDRCVLESRVVIKSGAMLGADNHVFEGAVLGGVPQHARVPQRVGSVRIGDGNTIRENVTIHRALAEDRLTLVGDRNLFMVNAHIAHDCQVGSQIVIANNTCLAGHVIVQDRAFLSANIGVHQFCRVGRMAMLGGHARVIKDVPPYVTVDGGSGYVVGLNSIGLRRNGYAADDLSQLKAAYRLIYRSGRTWKEILDVLSAEFSSGPAAVYAEFLSGTQRGIIPERRVPPGATIKLRDDAAQAAMNEPELRVKVG